ncbi:hypothetical protein POTOM_053306 [Populus tomentosa]|uniref:Uncharacterized protein n=1 Tax=Populus tomentosa TaxID=118781 RepID=A0A8X7YBS3_POPTO|nr:hypothetical protein POTOM_053306 [Populus tomentosa]
MISGLKPLNATAPLKEDFDTVAGCTIKLRKCKSNLSTERQKIDSGVYVIKFMLALEEVTNPDFVQYREVEVVLKLLVSDVNSCRNDLATKFEAYYGQRF